MPPNQAKSLTEKYARKREQGSRPAREYDDLLDPERTLPKLDLWESAKTRDPAHPEFDEIYFNLLDAKRGEAGTLGISVHREKRAAFIEDIEINMGKESKQYEKVVALKLLKYLATRGLKLISTPPLGDEERRMWAWMEEVGVARRADDAPDRYEVI